MDFQGLPEIGETEGDDTGRDGRDTAAAAADRPAISCKSRMRRNATMNVASALARGMHRRAGDMWRTDESRALRARARFRSWESSAQN